jgi:hypothetical protein
MTLELIITLVIFLIVIRGMYKEWKKIVKNDRNHDGR